MPSKEGKRLKEKVLPLINKVEDDEWSDEWELVRLFRPPSRSFPLCASEKKRVVIDR